MPKITEISEVLSTPNNCPFDAVCGVVSVAYPATEKEGKRGPYLIQNIELRDRTPGSTQRIKVFMMGLPEISKDLKGQQIIFTTGGKSKDNLARADNEWEGKTTLQLTAKGGTTWDILRDGVPVSPPAAQPPSQPSPRHQEAINDHLAGDPTPQAQTHAQRPSTAQGDVSVTIPTAAQAIAQVKEGMKRPALAILLCLEEVDVICVARFRRLVEKLNKAEPGSSEASYTNQLLKEEDEPNPELRIELLRSLLIQGGQSGLWDLLPLVSLDKKPTPPPAEAPAPVSAPPVAPAQPAPAKATKPQLPSHGQPGYNIDQDAPF